HLASGAGRDSTDLGYYGDGSALDRPQRAFHGREARIDTLDVRVDPLAHVRTRAEVVTRPADDDRAQRLVLLELEESIAQREPIRRSERVSPCASPKRHDGDRPITINSDV